MSDHTETTEEAIAALYRYADFVQKHSGEITVGHDALREYADRIEAAAEREREELVQSVEELRDGMCPHCDMRDLCVEGEDGMSTTCNAMAKVKNFIERHKKYETNDEAPF